MFQRHSSSNPGSRAPQQQASGSRSLAPQGGYGMPSLFRGDGGPFALLRQLDDDMNRLFDEFSSGRLSGGEGGWLPQIEMCERDGRLHVYADLPGMTKDDIKVDLTEGQLTLQGERRSAEEGGEQQQGYYRSERSYGSFYRSIPLPDGVNVDSAQASFRDGVLDVSFDAPKQQRRGRTLTIGDGSPTTSAGGRQAGAAQGATPSSDAGVGTP
jgi:HSP20 family protein